MDQATQATRRTALLAFVGSAVAGAGAVVLQASAGHPLIGQARRGLGNPTRARVGKAGGDGAAAEPGSAAARPGSTTRFGTVAVLGSSVTRIADDHETAHAHLAWQDALVAEVEARNESGRRVLVSSGQFRLRVGERGPTVSYVDTEQPLLVLAPGAVRRWWISFRTPPGHDALFLEYTDAGADRPIRTALTTPGVRV
jgi:hypothetical protein